MPTTTPQFAPEDLRALAWSLVEPVLAAGEIEMNYYRSGVAVQTKSDESPVTLADQEAEVLLLQALARVAPAIPVVAEEAVAAGKVPAAAETFFLVDPLDGTREFINQRDEFTVNVALVQAGKPILGLVYSPAIDDLYVAFGPGHAARASIAPGTRPATPEACTFVRIATRSPDRAALTAVASRSHVTEETEAYLARYTIAERRNSGSSLKFCAIARGDADIYPRLAPTMEWDTAAGHAVLAAAGGAVTAPDGTPFLYGKAAAGYRNGHFVAWGTPEPIPPTAAA
ncbi:MAG: 3'(2'),5'-bisphosphate nucleotidase CysQ [Hyphomicrobiaceae bacterium]